LAEHTTKSDMPLVRRLEGKIVLVVHPAWHSCGSHQVFVSQARAYRSLGATVISLAVAETPGCVEGSQAFETYMAASGDLDADMRSFAGVPLRTTCNGGFLRAGKQWLRGNFAAMRLEMARLAAIPDALRSVPRIDLIHCNHFFCMPVAVRLRAQHNCPVILDTHDLQARQYALRNRAGLRLPPRVSYEDMLAIECDAIRQADILVHLNGEEAAVFGKLIPDKRHALLYPAVGAMPAGCGGGDSIIVASANYPNFLGLCWFLQEVLPLVPGAPVRIFGNIDRELSSRAPALFKAHASLFQGRVEIEKLRDAYRRATAVLLPATAGHGISIKTIEAFSCGAPLIATPLALRGFAIDLGMLPNLVVAENAADFAAALLRIQASRHVLDRDRKSSPTRKLYEQSFAFDAYCMSLRTVLKEVPI
jgi:glycosyltransferase involved in cell wall biosynthesis